MECPSDCKNFSFLFFKDTLIFKMYVQSSICGGDDMQVTTLYLHLTQVKILVALRSECYMF